MHFKLYAPLVLAALVAAPSVAQDFKTGQITVSKPWSRQTAPGQRVGGAFMTITNAGASVDQLIGGSTPAAEKVEIHTMSMDGGIMRMRPLPDGAAVPARGTLALAPGGYHIMLIGLKQPLVLGSRVPLTLRFRKAGTVKVELTVQSVAYQGKGGEHGGH